MMPSNMVKEICVINEAGRGLLKAAMEHFIGLSARAYDNFESLCAPLLTFSGTTDIKIEHLAEAIQYRSLIERAGQVRNELLKSE